MLAQVDLNGHTTLLMKGIVDYRRDPAVAVLITDKYLMTSSGQRRHRKTTQGWEILVSWKDGSESWVKLSEMKESYPVEMAEFAKARGIDSQPAFSWWVPYTLKKLKAILSAVKARMKMTTHKYGIEASRTI